MTREQLQAAYEHRWRPAVGGLFAEPLSQVDAVWRTNNAVAEMDQQNANRAAMMYAEGLQRAVDQQSRNNQAEWQAKNTLEQQQLARNLQADNLRRQLEQQQYNRQKDEKEFEFNAGEAKWRHNTESTRQQNMLAEGKARRESAMDLEKERSKRFQFQSDLRAAGERGKAAVRQSLHLSDDDFEGYLEGLPENLKQAYRLERNGAFENATSARNAAIGKVDFFNNTINDYIKATYGDKPVTPDQKNQAISDKFKTDFANLKKIANWNPVKSQFEFDTAAYPDPSTIRSRGRSTPLPAASAPGPVIPAPVEPGTSAAPSAAVSPAVPGFGAAPAVAPPPAAVVPAPVTQTNAPTATSMPSFGAPAAAATTNAPVSVVLGNQEPEFPQYQPEREPIAQTPMDRMFMSNIRNIPPVFDMPSTHPQTWANMNAPRPAPILADQWQATRSAAAGLAPMGSASPMQMQWSPPQTGWSTRLQNPVNIIGPVGEPPGPQFSPQAAQGFRTLPGAVNSQYMFDARTGKLIPKRVNVNIPPWYKYAEQTGATNPPARFASSFPRFSPEPVAMGREPLPNVPLMSMPPVQDPAFSPMMAPTIRDAGMAPMMLPPMWEPAY